MIKLQNRVMLLAGLGLLALVPGAWADAWNQKTVFTFDGPVEIPGQILPAGTYVFKLANSDSNRNIVQVFNQQENQVFGTFLAIPDYRLQAANKSIIRFEERAAGQPQAVKAWFYPGHKHGHEFVYPKTEALALAKANNTRVPSMPAELAQQTTMPRVTLTGPVVLALNMAPLKAEEPTGGEVEVAEAFGTPDSPAASAVLPDKLPETASSLPFIGLIGLLSLGTAITLRLAAARVK
jgi:hypothetical protein